MITKFIFIINFKLVIFNNIHFQLIKIIEFSKISHAWMGSLIRWR